MSAATASGEVRLGAWRAIALATALAVVLMAPSVVVMAPSAALAATSTTNPLSAFPAPPVSTAPPSQTQAIVTNASSSTAGSSGLSGSSAIAIVVGALVVLTGISFFIWRDARKRAPVRATSGGVDADGQARRGSKPPPKPRKPSPAERRRRKRGRARK